MQEKRSEAPTLAERGDSTQTWGTPWHIIEAIERDSIGGRFSLDCCAQPYTTKCDRFYAIERLEDGLALPWVDATWNNPPYAEQDRWLARAAWWGSQGVRVACLVLASTSSLYWRPTTMALGTVDFYEGRISFLNEHGVAVKGTSFSSALVLYGPGFAAGRVRYRSAETGELIGSTAQVDLFAVTGGA